MALVAFKKTMQNITNERFLCIQPEQILKDILDLTGFHTLLPYMLAALYVSLERKTYSIDKKRYQQIEYCVRYMGGESNLPKIGHYALE